ncbi:hypothetical protein F7018_09380 [Tenacibaculum aiptasiae]|uniref:Lipocalin-like domain-containing protein n=1 Tax=Tenacibaculum aiptasiae TaxID=426481 RepID=A0A7J5ALN3_9FLAO|nr:lipocalin family protein [Tenacibaculum aiptasiae]KAB1158378.1 hypothetical protein F7018_09380 [Tenacibaculum aiptasiae]
MKKIMLMKLVLIFSIITFTSCTDSDENINYNQNDLIGEWKLTNYKYDGNLEISGGPITIPKTSFVGEGININATTAFTENPNKTNASGSYDIKTTSTTSGQTHTETFKVENITSEADWELNNNILTIKNGELIKANLPDQINNTVNLGDADFKITELTPNSLKLRKTIEQKISQGGITVNTTINIVIDYTK